MKALLWSFVAIAAGAAVGAIAVGTYTALTMEATAEHAAAPEGDPVAPEASVTPGDLPPPAPSGETGGPHGDRAEASKGALAVSAEPRDPSEGTAPTGADVAPTVADRSPGALDPSEPRPDARREPDPDSLARLNEDFQRLARIFAAMKPDEAAPVLAQLEDHELEGILLAMQGRNAAPILAEMDPERAARVSRRVLRGNRED